MYAKYKYKCKPQPSFQMFCGLRLKPFHALYINFGQHKSLATFFKSTSMASIGFRYDQR